MKFDVIIFIAGHTKLLSKQNSRRLDYSFTYMNNLHKATIISDISTKTRFETSITNNKPVVITTIKSKDALETIKKRLINYHDKTKKNMNIVVFDDECDFASASSKSSAVTLQLEEMYNYFNCSSTNSIFKYVGVSATPYPNCISESILTPELVVPLKSPKDYTGLDYFDEDKFWNTESYGNDDHLHENIINKVVIHVINSVHKNDGKGVQFIICDEVNIDKHNESIAQYRKFIKKIRQATYYFSNQINEFMKPFYNNGLDRDIDYDTFKKYVDSIELVALNTGNEDISVEADDKVSQIYVGNYILGRGVTFTRLCGEFFVKITNKQSRVETWLQRARWFGYRRNVPYDIIIFCKPDLKKYFHNIKLVDEQTRKLYINSKFKNGPGEVQAIKDIFEKNKLNLGVK